MIQLTDSAVTAVTRFIDQADKPIFGLRIKIDGGGCSGFKYGMKLEEASSATDLVFDCSGVKILVDSESVALLDGVTVDFMDGLEGTGFKFENPNATESCNCGKSFAG